MVNRSRLRLCCGGALKRGRWGEPLNLLILTHNIGHKADPKADLKSYLHILFFPPQLLRIRDSASVMPHRARTVTSFVQGIQRIRTAPPTQGNLTQQTVPCYKLKWESLKAFLEQRFPSDIYPKLEFKERKVRCWSQHDLLIRPNLLVLRLTKTTMYSWPLRL